MVKTPYLQAIDPRIQIAHVPPVVSVWKALPKLGRFYVVSNRRSATTPRPSFADVILGLRPPLEGSFEWTIECLGLSQEQTSASAALMSQSDPKRTSSDLPDLIKLQVGENAHHIRMADNDLPREASLAKWNSF
jgi:hypothetical protein